MVHCDNTAIHNGISVTIEVNNKDLDEYTNNEHPDETSTVTKFVKVENGQHFAIKIDVSNFGGGSSALAFRIFLDRKFAKATSRSMLDKRKITKPFLLEGVNEASTDSVYVFKRFKFTAVHEVDNHRLQPSTLRLDDLDEIRVTAHRLQNYRNIGLYERKKRSLPDMGSVTLRLKEVAKCGLTHTVGFEETTKRQELSRWKYNYIDPKDKPMMSFKFKYRSYRMLQNMLVIPRTPVPTPPPALEERDVNTLSMEELLEIARRSQVRFKEDIQRQGAVKREKVKDEEDDKTNVKRVKLEGFAKEEIIQLDD